LTGDTLKSLSKKGANTMKYARFTAMIVASTNPDFTWYG